MNPVAARLLGSRNARPSDRYPDWASILKPAAARWEAARAAARRGPRVLIANSGGRDPHITTVDSVLAVALTLRGADVHILHCDEALPACKMAHSKRVLPEQFVNTGPSKHLCGECFQNGIQVFCPLQLPIHRYGDLITADDRAQARELAVTVPADQLAAFRLDGMAVGEHALAGALRYFARGDLRDEPHGEAVLRRYFEASVLSMAAIRRLLGTGSFESVCGHTGMYVPDGVLGEVGRHLNVRTVCWAEAYRKQTLIFSHYDTYHRTMLSEPVANWDQMPWTPEMELELLEYLKSRWYGSHDWIGYTQDWADDASAVAAGIGIDFTKPCIGLLTNVIWDAQVHYGGNAFSSMLEWTLETIRYFANRPDLQLIVRVHPAEVRGHHVSRQLMVDEIKRAIPDLPKNVFVVPPDSSLNTYAAMLKCDAVIIYGTKVGVELSSLGVPVIVAGEAWIRNKGLTLDASSAQEYFALLDCLPLGERMGEAAVRQARKYAYHYFFRRLIPLPFLREGAGLFKLDVAGIDDLLPGRYPGLDVICDGILRGREFIYPAESYPGPVATSGKFTIGYSAALAASSKSKPLVSVIIPTDSQSLSGALASVYAQHGAGQEFDVEIVVVDNASAAGAPDIPGGHHCVRLEQAATSSVVRNAGIKASKGAYLAFLEDGDLWLPERLRSQVAVLEAHPEFGAAYGQFVATGFGKDTPWPDARTAPAGSVFNAFVQDEYAFPSFLTVRREALEKAGCFDETLDAMAAYDMTVRLAFFARLAFVAGPVGTRRFSDDRAWSGRLERGLHRTELPQVLANAFALLPDTTEARALRRDVLTHWFTVIARRLDKPESAELLRSHVFHSIRERPWLMTRAASRRRVFVYAARALSRTLRLGR